MTGVSRVAQHHRQIEAYDVLYRYTACTVLHVEYEHKQ